jgi:lipopolysaccharide export system permease protein
LKFGGNLVDYGYEESIRLKYLYEDNSKLAFILYAITILIILPGLILKNNGFATIGQALFVCGIIVGILYLFALIKSLIDSSNLNKHLGKNNISNALIFILFGMPFYFVFYFFQKKKIGEDLKINQTKNKTVNRSENSINVSTIEGLSTVVNDYKVYSKFAFIFFTLSITLLILYFVFKNNKLPAAENASIELSAISGLLFLLYSIVSNLYFKKIYQLIGNTSNLQLLWSILGLIIYPFVYFKRQNKISEDFSAKKK